MKKFIMTILHQNEIFVACILHQTEIFTTFPVGIFVITMFKITIIRFTASP